MANYNAILNVTFDNGTVVEPLTLEAARLYMKIDLNMTEDDTLITALITTARQVIEAYTNESIIERNVEAIMCNLCGKVYLPYSPVTGEIVLKDKDDATISQAVILGENRPYIESPKLDYIKATYAAGYTRENLPSKYITALKMQVLYMYENRGDLQVAPTVKTILSNARKL